MKLNKFKIRLNKDYQDTELNGAWFGSDDWFRNIRKENLVKIVEGKVSRIYMAGHNDFPMFEVTCGNDKYEFAMVGDKNRYKIGSKIIVECLLNESIRPSSGLEKVLEPIKIEIEK